MTRKLEPMRGCWKFVDIIEDSGMDRDSKDGAVLPDFEASETKMNCGVGGTRLLKIQCAVDVLLNSLVCEPCLASALEFLGTA